MSRLTEIWEKACDIMQSKLDPIQFESWIKNGVEPYLYENKNYLLIGKTQFYYDIVITRCMQVLSESVQAVLGRDTNVVLLTREKAEKYKTTGKLENEFEKSNLMDKYTFGNFVVGSANSFAHAASLAVASDPGKSYNPLFLYGGVGLGKTHLMHAIGNYMVSKGTEKKVYYATSEQFTSEMIQSIRTNQNAAFRTKYRDVDVLIIDDIQFIAGREGTQEEFFHTFNALYTAGKQIVLSSDRPPREIAKLEERLKSRFSSGLLADISKPDLDTRIAILKEKAKSLTVSVDDEVIEMIANKIESNIRELEGALTRLNAYANLVHASHVDIPLALEALKELFSEQAPRALSPEDVLNAVCEYYQISRDEITSPKRARSVALPRQMVMYLSRELTNASLPSIGNVLGGRDHTTVMHGCDKISELSENSSPIKTAIDDIKHKLK